MSARLIPMLATLMSGLALLAAPPKIDATASLSFAGDGLRKATHQTLGFALGAGLRGVLPETELPYRAALTLNHMPGARYGTIRTDLRLIQASFDVYLGAPEGRIAPKFGFSANRYTVNNDGPEVWGSDPLFPPAGLNPQYVYAVRNTAGLKAGLRLGLDVNLTKTWAVEILYQATELGGSALLPGNRPTPGSVNPSWLQVGARHTF